MPHCFLVSMGLKMLKVTQWNIWTFRSWHQNIKSTFHMWNHLDLQKILHNISVAWLRTKFVFQCLRVHFFDPTGYHWHETLESTCPGREDKRAFVSRLRDVEHKMEHVPTFDELEFVSNTSHMWIGLANGEHRRERKIPRKNERKRARIKE